MDTVTERKPKAYTVEIIRTVVGRVEVEASDEFEARDKAREMDFGRLQDCEELEPEYVVLHDGKELLRD